MKLAYPLLPAVAGFCLLVPASSVVAATPKVEVTVVGPMNVGGDFVVAKSGGRVAHVGAKGTKFVVKVDGVDGPVFDEIYQVAGGQFRVFDKPRVLQAHRGGVNAGNNQSTVAFSEDGAHYAYAGVMGADYVVIYDGKEIGRGPRANYDGSGMLFGRLMLSPLGKFVTWREYTVDRQGRGSWRVVVSGKAGPWCSDHTLVTFSADESRYGYFVPQKRDNGKPALIVDGQEVSYEGQEPVFTADGSTVLSISRGTQAGVFVNGKLALTGVAINKLVAAPVGARWAVIGARMNRPAMSGPTLFVDGQEVAGSDFVENVWFSPDGKHYAADIRNQTNYKTAMLIDGKAYPFARIDPIDTPKWTADGSKFVYSAATASTALIVANDEMYEHPMVAAPSVVLPAQGDKWAWTLSHNSSRTYIVQLGERALLPAGVYPTSNIFLSPDASRYAFHVAPIGRANTTGFVSDGRMTTGLTPGYFSGYALASKALMDAYRFSPNSKHLVYAAGTPGSPTTGLYVDDRRVFSAANGVYYPTFTPDSRHLFWASDELPAATAVYVDGQLALRAKNGSAFGSAGPGQWTMNKEGVVTFIAGDGDEAKAYRITAPTDTSIETLLAGANTPAVASAPPPASAPRPVAKAPTPPAPKAPSATGPSATPSRGTAKSSPARTGPAGPQKASIPAPMLTWDDLVRRPETRPAACVVGREFRFPAGVVAAGTTVQILDLKPAAMLVGTADGRFKFNAKPEETNVLFAANSSWLRLTDAQRELTYAALLKQPELWPYRVRLKASFEVDGKKTRAGEAAILLGVEGDQLLVLYESFQLSFNVEPVQTDLLQQARLALAMEAGPVGRVIEDVMGKTVSPLSGKPVALDIKARPQYVVLYMGAGWCAPCQAFAPKLVQALQQKPADPEKYSLIFLSVDRSGEEAKAYLTKLAVDWPTVFFKNRGQLPVFGSMFKDAVPQLVIMDRHGKVLVDSAKSGTDAALDQLKKIL